MPRPKLSTSGPDIERSFLPAAITDDALCFETIDLMLSFEVWQRLRDEQKLATDRAHDIVLTEVLRLVTDR